MTFIVAVKELVLNKNRKKAAPTIAPTNQKKRGKAFVDNRNRLKSYKSGGP